MSDLELREKVAVRVMGLKVRVIKNDDGFHAGEWVRCYDGGGSWSKDYLGDGGLVVDHENDMPREVPHYESDTAAASQVEAEIERRGLLVAYAKVLAAIVDPTDITDPGDGKWLSWFMVGVMLRATPEQRCRAALAAIEATQ